MNFVCPKCRGALTLSGGAAKCPLGHSFDRAKEGYFNLLLSSVGGTHGDNREMTLARRAFLDTGAYFPLADTVAMLAEKYLSGKRVLDIGCGEGYYTDIIERRLSSKKDAEVFAFDISRDAVKRAAKRNHALSLAVASAYHMPVADGSFDMAINLFSPLAREEIHRALAPLGIFIMAIPAENHLFSLKRVLYENPYKNEVQPSFLEGFSLIEERRLCYDIELSSGENIASLFKMTPYAYRTPREARERLFSLTSLKVEADFTVFVYRRDE